MSDADYKDKYNAKGEEVMDPTPMAVPAGYRRPPTLHEQMARFMRSSQLLAHQQGAESFEEADDFEVGDDYDPTSPWELDFDPELGKEIPKDQKQYLDHSRKKFDEHVKNSRSRRAKAMQEEKPKKKSRVKQQEEDSDED